MATVYAKARTGTGKGVAYRLRQEGLIPAVVYGGGQPTRSITLERKAIIALILDVGRELKTVPQNLVIDTGAGEAVLLRELQRHPLTGLPVHIDWIRFDPTKEIDVKVPTVIIGIENCVGLKHGGMLQHVTRELEMRCLAGSIPHTIEVSVANLAIGHSIHLRDLTFAEGIEVAGDPNLVIAAIGAPVGEPAEGEEAAG